MGSGPKLGTIIQLQCVGPEDAHTFLDPQVTFFGPPDVVDHTGYEAIFKEQSFESSPRPRIVGAGLPRSFSTCNLSTTGSLIGMTHLQVSLPLVDPGTRRPIRYDPMIAIRMIDYVSLRCNGQELERLTQPALMWYFMVVDEKLRRDPRARAELLSGTVIGDSLTVLLPVPFFFSRRSVAEKLPVRGNDLKVELCFGSVESCVAPSAFLPAAITPDETKLITTVYTLARDEDLRNGANYEQLVTQIKTQTEPLGSLTGSAQSVCLDFNQPIKRLAWFCVDSKGRIVDGVIKGCRLTVDGVNYTERAPPCQPNPQYADEAYFRLLQPFKQGGVSHPGVYSFGFCLENSESYCAAGDMGGGKRPITYDLERGSSRGSLQTVMHLPNGSMDLSGSINYLEVLYSRESVDFGRAVELVIVGELYNLLSTNLVLEHL